MNLYPTESGTRLSLLWITDVCATSNARSSSLISVDRQSTLSDMPDQADCEQKHRSKENALVVSDVPMDLNAPDISGMTDVDLERTPVHSTTFHPGQNAKNNLDSSLTMVDIDDGATTIPLAPRARPHLTPGDGAPLPSSGVTSSLKSPYGVLVVPPSSWPCGHLLYDFLM
jgi:hypothetical protein